jgi:hypothetical protein
MAFPYDDLAGVAGRSNLDPTYFQDVEEKQPGYTAESILSHQSYIEGRLRKRCGRSLPFGQSPPKLDSAGLNPPAVSLQGRAVVGSVRMQIQIPLGGPLGTATFQWSQDAGASWSVTAPTAATVLLGATGLVVVFPPGTYDVSNVYAASPPVPRIILKWLNKLVTADVLERHGPPQERFGQMVQDEAKTARDELLEAANSRDGLFDLPTQDDQGSAVSTGGPFFYSETSPYVSQDIQERRGAREDESERGRFRDGR